MKHIGPTNAWSTPGWPLDKQIATIVLRFFKWDVNTQSIEALDTLERLHIEELQRPV